MGKRFKMMEREKRGSQYWLKLSVYTKVNEQDFTATTYCTSIVRFYYYQLLFNARFYNYQLMTTVRFYNYQSL